MKKHWYYDKFYEKHKDKIGSYPFFWSNDKKEKRKKAWKKQREKYGFDERETWNLDYTFITWVYERFSMYKDIGSEVVDLEYHKFTVEGKEYTQLQLINIILELCEFLLKNDDSWKEEYYAVYSELLKLFSVIIPAMWW